jgi:hypothetical protein
MTKALTNFIRHERMKDLSWKERFQYQLDDLRRNVKEIGVINDNQIDQTIKKYRDKNKIIVSKPKEVVDTKIDDNKFSTHT